MKKILSLTIILVIVMGAMTSATVFSAYEDNDTDSPPVLDTVYTTDDGRFKYQLDVNNNAYLISFTDSEIDYCKVPSEFDGYSVISIEKNAFAGKTSLTSVKLSKSVYDIKENAFKGCTALKEFSTNSYVQIHSRAFAGCTSLATVSLKDGIAFENAFSGCKNLSRITVNSSFILYDSSAGYYGKSSKVKGFMLKILLDENHFGVNDTAFDYIKNNGFNNTVIMSTRDFSSKLENYEVNSGIETTLRIKGKSLKTWKSSDSTIAKITKSGKLITLNKGTVKISVRNGKKTYTKTFTVQNSPVLEPIAINAKSKADLKKTYSVTVKKGQSSKVVKILYKAKSIDNIFEKDKSGVAKLFGNLSSDKFKIKGLNKGNTTLRIKVNGTKTIKIKVKVI